MSRFDGAAALALACLAITAEAGELRRFDFECPAMGTRFRIAAFIDDEAKAQAAAQEARARIEALNRIFSDYIPDSEIRRLIETAQTPVAVSKELFDIVAKSNEVAALSNGAFDITAGPMIQLWRKSRREKALPAPERLGKARSLASWKFIELDSASQTVRLAKPGMLLDLGGIAKGFAADAALAVLRTHGISRAVVSAGGDLAIGDPPPDLPGWEVKLRTFSKPGPDERLITLHLSRCGVSTSGDLYQFVEIAGQRYSHIIDPKTGLGLTRPIACTVIAPNATTSDAWATALCVMGAAEGIAACERLAGFHARYVELRDGSEPFATLSSRFPEK